MGLSKLINFSKPCCSPLTKGRGDPHPRIPRRWSLIPDIPTAVFNNGWCSATSSCDWTLDKGGHTGGEVDKHLGFSLTSHSTQKPPPPKAPNRRWLQEPSRQRGGAGGASSRSRCGGPSGPAAPRGTVPAAQQQASQLRLKVTCSPPCRSSRCCWGWNIWLQSTRGSRSSIVPQAAGGARNERTFAGRGALSKERTVSNRCRPQTAGALSTRWAPGWSINPPLWTTVLSPAPTHTHGQGCRPGCGTRARRGSQAWGTATAASASSQWGVLAPPLFSSRCLLGHVCAKLGCSAAVWGRGCSPHKEGKTVHKAQRWVEPVGHQPPLSVCLLPAAGLVTGCDILYPL